MFEKKFRNWFLTVNNDASCFNLDFLISKLSNYRCDYALIFHDKDNEEQPHYHIWLKFENGRTFSTLKSVFVGAHIETTKDLLRSCKYLCHRTEDSKDKFQYSFEDVVCNFDYSSYVGGFCDSFPSFEINEFMLLLYEGVFRLGLPSIIIHYGLDQYKKYRLVIQDLLHDYSSGLHSSIIFDLKKNVSSLGVCNEKENS